MSFWPWKTSATDPVDFERGTRRRFTGVAEIADDDPLVDGHPGVQCVTRVCSEAVFLGRRRYGYYYELVELVEVSPVVLSASSDPPILDWRLDSRFEGKLGGRPGPRARPSQRALHP